MRITADILGQHPDNVEALVTRGTASALSRDLAKVRAGARVVVHVNRRLLLSSGLCVHACLGMDFAC